MHPLAEDIIETCDRLPELPLARGTRRGNLCFDIFYVGSDLLTD